MNTIHKTLVLLLRSAITGDCYEMPCEYDLEAVFQEAKRHSLISMAYAGAVNCKIDKNLPVMKQMLASSFSEVLFSEKQLHSVDKISRAFEENGIDYMLLKGCNMKKRYPKPEMRAMGDADILIREKDYETARKIVEELGFVKDNRDGDHSRNFASKNLYLELHVRFIARNELPKFADYFGDGWGKAALVEGHQYEISLEDEFVFSFLHFYKHYIYSGIGLKHIIDLWIFLEKCGKLNLDYIENELKSLGVHTFYKNVTNSIKVLFDDAKGDEKTDAIIDHVLKCGTFGTAEISAVSRGVATKQKLGKSSRVRTYTALKIIFPPRRDLKSRYPILEKHGYLLPIMWIVRWFDVLLHKRDKIAFRRKEIELISSKKIDEREEKFALVGINLAD